MTLLEITAHVLALPSLARSRLTVFFQRPLRAAPKKEGPLIKGTDLLLRKSIPEAWICDLGPLTVGSMYGEAVLKTGSIGSLCIPVRAEPEGQGRNVDVVLFRLFVLFFLFVPASAATKAKDRGRGRGEGRGVCHRMPG